MVMKGVIQMVTMENMDSSLNILATLPFAIVYKLLMVMGELNISLRSVTIPHIIHLVLLYCWVYMLLLVPFTNVFMVMKEGIVVMIMIEMNLGIKRLYTIPFTII